MELYHVFNRGVDKRSIATDKHDQRRFVRDLYEMNTAEAVNNLWYRANNPFSDVGRRYREERLVTIHAWCLMRNHYHLLVSENNEEGLSKFLKKLNMGYAKYFNERYNRSGALFQGKTKKVLIQTEAHFLWILHYIHLNPLDYNPGTKSWRTQCLRSPAQALQYLEKYPWSSYGDYAEIKKEDHSPILEGSFLFKDREQYASETKRYLKTMADMPVSSQHLEN